MVYAKELRRWFSKAERVVIAGIGNPIRMDDFVGVRVVRSLQGNVGKNVCLIECETVPEGFAQQIVEFDPSHVLLVDAAALGRKPGESALIAPEKLTAFPAISTHSLPLRVFCDFLRENTKAKIALLLIEPLRVDFGDEMSRTVEDSAKEIVRSLLDIFAER